MSLSGRRRLLIVAVAVVPLLLVGQQNTTTGQSGTSNSDAFCSRWDEARSALLDEKVENRDEGLQSFDEAAEQQLEILDSTDALVPPEIRAEWDAAADFRRAVTELFFTVDPERVRPIHLELAFGDADPEIARGRRDGSRRHDRRVDGHRLRRLLRPLARDRTGDPGRMNRTSSKGPSCWPSATGPTCDCSPRSIPSSPTNSARRGTRCSRRDRSSPTRSRRTPENRGSTSRVQMSNLDEYLEELGRLIEPVATWAGANCDTTTRSDAPGTLTVRLQLTDDSLGSTVFVAVVEPGAPITSLESNAASSAAIVSRSTSLRRRRRSRR